MALLQDSSISPQILAELAYASGEVPAGPSQTAATTRHRRSNGSSSDETPIPTIDGWIEEDLRAGGPRLCESPCVSLHSIPRNHPYHDMLEGRQGCALTSQLHKICSAADLPCMEMHLCRRQCTMQPDLQPITTLLVLAKRHNLLDRGHWVDVAARLLGHLRSQGLQEMSVEIIDPRFDEGPNIYPCFGSDAVFPVWQAVVRGILARVDLTGIYTIGCFRIGADNDRRCCPPAVLIGVDAKIQKDWRVVREGVVAVLSSWGLRELEVRIRKDTRAPAVTGGAEHAEAEECRPDPQLGSRLAPRLMHESQGTLGGWIELKSPGTGEWVPFALTCSHCSIPSQEVVSAADRPSMLLPVNMNNR